MVLPGLQPGSGQRKMTVAEFTIDRIEELVHRKRWCAYCAMFHDLDSFADFQKIEKWQRRYCQEFSNNVKRAGVTRPPAVVPRDQLVSLSRTVKVMLTDLPAEEAVVSQRDQRSAKRQASPGAAGSGAAGSSGQRPNKRRRRGKAVSDAEQAAAGIDDAPGDGDSDEAPADADSGVDDELEELRAEVPDYQGPAGGPSARGKGKAAMTPAQQAQEERAEHAKTMAGAQAAMMNRLAEKSQKDAARKKELAAKKKAGGLPLAKAPAKTPAKEPPVRQPLTQAEADESLRRWCPSTHEYDNNNTDDIRPCATTARGIFMTTRASPPTSTGSLPWTM
jgi:hypothetical protein